MNDEERAKIFYLETRQRSDTPEIEARIIWAHSAGLCAGREQERERIIDKLKEIGFTNVDAAIRGGGG